ncbi:Piwi-like protein 1 [Orchesella cincta]|uniref:Piwi-like protein 1 n=1 Tax=Orchesella cincta TaxID=48709 RepID=A0A1D2M5Y3_ORCCI|nr:Piwi-like protein 1 [Orchesella cincta]
MSSLGRGRGRGRPPITPNQDQEGVQRSPAAAVEGNPTEDVAAAVVPPVPRRQEVTMQELVERYADPDQPEELQALREMAIMQIASPASPEGQTPKDTSNRAAPSRPRSPPLPLAAQLAVAGSSGSGAVGQRPPSSGSASGYYRTAVGSASGISGAPVSVAQPEQPPVVAPVVQPEQPPVVAPVVQPQPDDAEIANRAVETAVTAKSPRRTADYPELDVATNYIRLKLATGRPGIVEYHVSYSVPIESVAIRRKALKQFEHRLGLVKSFDGMILFLPYILDDDVKPMKDAIPFFNILLRRIMIELGFVEIRREFYDLELAQFLKQHRLEIWPGFNPVAENQEDGLMINVDACSRVLRMDTVYDYYLMIKGDPKGKQKFNEFVVNKIVITKYNHVTYRVDDVAWDMTPMTEFERKGQTCTFVDYLKHHHNYIVKDTTQPMLISKLKPRKNDRLTQSDTTQRVAALVPECCHMTGLTEDQRNNFKVMTDLAGSTRQPTAKSRRPKKIHRSVMKCEPAQELLSQWSLEIVPGIIHVEGRKMDGPGLSFGDRVNLSKAGPDFSREAGLSVYDPIEVKRYAVISTQRDSDKAKRFIEMYQQVSKPLGIKMMQLGTRL